mgnify:FL=1
MCDTGTEWRNAGDAVATAGGTQLVASFASGTRSEDDGGQAEEAKAC